MLSAQAEVQFVCRAVACLRYVHCLAVQMLQMPLEIRDKGTDMRDLVTQVDETVELYLKAQFVRDFPAFAFFGEETHKSGERINPEIPTIVVDPLDGTTNFVAGIPFVAVSIGLWYQNQARAAAVMSFADGGAIHTATRCADDVQVFVEDGLFARPCQITPRINVDQALIGFDWPRQDDRRRALLPTVVTCLNTARNVRMLGSAVLGLLAVAQGVLDAYVHDDVFLWDVAAAGLIVEKAGGRLTDFAGRPWTPETTQVVASSGPLHDKIVEMLQGS